MEKPTVLHKKKFLSTISFQYLPYDMNYGRIRSPVIVTLVHSVECFFWIDSLRFLFVAIIKLRITYIYRFLIEVSVIFLLFS